MGRTRGELGRAESVRPATPADEEPFRFAASGNIEDPAAFAELVRPHWATMFRLARRLAGGAADDVLQDALAAAWRSRRRFDLARGSAQSWLLAIVANEARDTRTRYRPTVELDDEHDAAPPAADRVGAVDVTAALRRLTVRQRETVALFYYLDLPIEECAAVLDCSVGTVKSTLSDARRRLRSVLGEEYR